MDPESNNFFSQNDQKKFFSDIDQKKITNSFGFSPLDIDKSKLKLAFLKENLDYQKKFEEVINCPLDKKIRLFFDNIVEKFGLNKNFLREAYSFKISPTEVLALLNPFKNYREVTSKKLVNMLPNLFVRPAIIELFKAQKLARFGEPVTKTWDILEPYERLLKIDLRKRKSELLNEFQNYIEHESGIQEAAKQVWPKNLQLSYLLWEPENERQRKEAWIQLEVWKLRKQYKCYPEIAMLLNLKKDTAKKSFYKAHERIYGKPYSKSTFKDIVRQHLGQQIKTEPNEGKKIKLFEDRLKLDEKKQTEKIMDFHSDIKAKDTGTFEEDPGVKSLIRDIKGEYCQNCPDIECQKIFYDVCEGGNPKAWDPCPKVIEFIRL